MANRQDYPRTSLDDVEGGTAESAPLLGHDDGQGQQETGAHQGQHWSEYPAKWWAQTQEYVRGVQRRRSDRGKQRQQQANDTAINDEQPADQGRQRTLRRLRSQHPHAFIAVSALCGLIAVVLLLIAIVLLHLFLVTLRSPDDATQQRILARSFKIDGPDNVQVVRMAEDGLTVQIDGRIGMDPDAALNEWLGLRESNSWWKRKDRDIVEWALNKVKGVQVDVDTLAVRSPDWNVDRPVDRINLIPDDGKGVWTAYDDGHFEAERNSPSNLLPPSDLVTFNIEPLLVPVPSVGSGGSKGDKGADGPDATTPINLTVVLKPSGPALLAYAQHTLENKTAFIDVQVKSARIRGLNAKDWLRGAVSSSSWWSVPGWVNLHMDESWKRLAQKLPKLDGNDTQTDEFLNLTRYDFQELGGPGSKYPERALGLDAYAEAKNPLGKLLVGHVGYSLPFGAFLPLKKDNKTLDGKQPKDVVLLAAVATEPFDIHGEDKIPLLLHGRVIPPPQPAHLQTRSQRAMQASRQFGDNAAADTLSDFLSRFLRGDPNTLYVRGGSPFAQPKVYADKLPMPGGGSDDLPVWLDRLLRTMSVPITFPGSKVTDLIQNVSISDLKITPHPFEKDKLVCSGVIMGVMNMPGQLATVNVEITDLWPDVLIFNGKPPSMKHGNGGGDDRQFAPSAPSGKFLNRNSHTGDDDDDDGDDDDTPTPDPLPDPLPEHAFGRVVPRKWAPAETYIDPEDPKGERKLLRSELKNVPFTVLPGRGAEFRSFSWKIVTGEGARAGIEGKAKAKIWNSGLGKLMLSNLPVKGVFTVGKRGSGGDDGDGDGDDGFAVSS